jgi:hypothetical protein
VAVDAIDPVVARVVTVVELDWLDDRRVLTRCKRRADVDHRRDDERDHDRGDRDEGDPVRRIRPAREQQRHARDRCNPHTITCRERPSPTFV